MLKALREDYQIIYKGMSTKIKTDLSTEILKARMNWSDAQRKKIIAYPCYYILKVTFSLSRKIKTFLIKYKQKTFMITKPALQKILKGILNMDEEDTTKGIKQGGGIF